MRVRETGKEKKRKTPACCFSADEMGLFGVACIGDLYPLLSDSGLGVDGNSAACVSGWLGMLWGSCDGLWRGFCMGCGAWGDGGVDVVLETRKKRWERGKCGVVELVLYRMDVEGDGGRGRWSCICSKLGKRFLEIGYFGRSLRCKKKPLTTS